MYHILNSWFRTRYSLIRIWYPIASIERSISRSVPACMLHDDGNPTVISGRTHTAVVSTQPTVSAQDVSFLSLVRLDTVVCGNQAKDQNGCAKVTTFTNPPWLSAACSEYTLAQQLAQQRQRWNYN